MTTVTERDDQGRPSQWLTEIEPEFDATERDNWLAMWEYEEDLCPQCGRLRSICEDPNVQHNPQIDTCYATATQMMHSRRWHRQFKDTKPDKDGWLPTDGAMIWVTDDLPPDPAFGLEGELGQSD